MSQFLFKILDEALFYALEKEQFYSERDFRINKIQVFKEKRKNVVI